MDGSWPVERWREALARPETWDEVLQEVQGGKTLGAIARERGWPRLRFRNHVLMDSELRAQYLAAREMAGDDLAVEALEIARTPEVGETVKLFPDGKKEITYADMLGHRKLRVDTNLRIAKAWNRGTYGDSVHVEQDLSISVKVQRLTEREVIEGAVAAAQSEEGATALVDKTSPQTGEQDQR